MTIRDVIASSIGVIPAHNVKELLAYNDWTEVISYIVLSELVRLSPRPIAYTPPTPLYANYMPTLPLQELYQRIVLIHGMILALFNIHAYYIYIHPALYVHWPLSVSYRRIATLSTEELYVCVCIYYLLTIDLLQRVMMLCILVYILQSVYSLCVIYSIWLC
jgi:hypothetical protein